MDIGKTLFYFRESLSLSQTDFCKGVISNSHYCKVERGISSISVDLLINLLKKNNISTSEFFLKLNNSSNFNFIEIYKKIKIFYFEENTFELLKLQKKIQKEHPYFFIINLLISKINCTELESDNKDRQKVYYYVMNLERWKEIDYLIFALACRVLNIDQILFIFNSFLRNTTNNSIYIHYEKDMSDSILQIIYECLMNDKISEANYFLSLPLQFLSDPFYIFEKILTNFFRNFILYRQNETNKIHFDKCKEIISFLEEYQLNKLSKSLNILLLKSKHNSIPKDYNV